LVLSIFRFSVLSQWFTFQYSVCCFCFLYLVVTVCGMVSCGSAKRFLIRGTPTFFTSYKPSRTT
ncbi:MAG TPA: hypothetical protein PKV61_07360, partial [Bacteroidales bacterium]|nr:hypothetical protein [Bacteroidales bacterium]